MGNTFEITTGKWHRFRGPFHNKSQRDLCRRRINRGVAALDALFGQDWPLDIITEDDELDMAAADRCVIGQMAPQVLAKLSGAEIKDYSNAYGEAVNALGWDYKKQMQLGFDEGGTIGYDQLQWGWETRIGELQRALRLR